MAQQTAVDWLFEQIPVEWTSTKYAFDAYRIAILMEQQQIVKGYWDGGQDLPETEERCQQYYNETFGK
jgi:hypothetical protein